MLSQLGCTQKSLLTMLGPILCVKICLKSTCRSHMEKFKITSISPCPFSILFSKTLKLWICHLKVGSVILFLLRFKFFFTFWCDLSSHDKFQPIVLPHMSKHDQFCKCFIYTLQSIFILLTLSNAYTQTMHQIWGC